MISTLINHCFNEVFMKNKRFVTVILIVISIVSCVYGGLTGEIRTVYQKASNICTECIGIG